MKLKLKYSRTISYNQVNSQFSVWGGKYPSHQQLQQWWKGIIIIYFFIIFFQKTMTLKSIFDGCLLRVFGRKLTAKMALNCVWFSNWWWFDGLVQERRNSSVLAMELHLFCINPSNYHCNVQCKKVNWCIEHYHPKNTNPAITKTPAGPRPPDLTWTLFV